MQVWSADATCYMLAFGQGFDSRGNQYVDETAYISINMHTLHIHDYGNEDAGDPKRQPKCLLNPGGICIGWLVKIFITGNPYFIKNRQQSTAVS